MPNKMKIIRLSVIITGIISFIWFLGFTWVYRSTGIIAPERITVKPPDYNFTSYDDIQKDSWVDKMYEHIGLIQGELDWSLAKIPLDSIISKSRKIAKSQGFHETQIDISLERMARGLSAYYSVSFSYKNGIPFRATAFFTGSNPDDYKLFDYEENSMDSIDHAVKQPT